MISTVPGGIHRQPNLANSTCLIRDVMKRSLKAADGCQGMTRISVLQLCFKDPASPILMPLPSLLRRSRRIVQAWIKPGAGHRRLSPVAVASLGGGCPSDLAMCLILQLRPQRSMLMALPDQFLQTGCTRRSRARHIKLVQRTTTCLLGPLLYLLLYHLPRPLLLRMPNSKLNASSKEL
jgi:hypothetical protein